MAYNDRPPGVTFVAVLAWLSAALQILLGILLLTGTLAADGVSVPSTWFSIAIGVITLLVSFGLFSGNRLARAIVTASLVLSILSAALQAVVHRDADVLVGSIVTILLAVFGIALLFTTRARRFFA
ncbi:hypothetical protein AB0O16_03000 [Microbacterium sp. NPDC089180]|uniref:hypothetical protein n=1 Tax=unclassified Microbacterium TaxID=2609290 RepID=UPI00341E05AC